MKERVEKKAWVVVIAAFLIMATCGGLNYAWSVFSKDMIYKWGWTATQATLPVSVFSFVSAFTAFLGGIISEKSPRLHVIICTLLFAVGLFICGSTQSVTGMVIGFGVLVGTASGMLCTGPIPTATKWWPKSKRGLITGIGHSGTAFCACYMSIVMAAILKAFGVSTGFRVVAVFSLVMGLIGSVFMYKPPMLEEKAVEDTPADANETNLKGMEAVRTAAFWKLIAIYILGGVAGQMVASQAAVIAQVQCNWQAGFIISALVGAFNGVGRVFFPAISDKISVYKAFMISYVISIANLLLFRFYTIPGLLMIGACVAGLCYGASITLIYTASAVEFGRKYMGTNYGLLSMAFAGSGTIGPMLGAWCIDRSGNYNLSYIIAAVLTFFAFLIAFNLNKCYLKKLESKR